MSVWPVPVQIHTDETFSSVLIRSALLHGCDPTVLTGWLWPKWRAWTYDLDRGIAPNRLSEMSQSSGTASEDLKQCFLIPEASQFSSRELPKFGIWPWIQALGARNRQYRGGIQVCPSCLRSDASPYLRKHWRFSWVTTCQAHRIKLIDNCPSCRKPIEPHCLSAINTAVLTVCSSCGTDFRSYHGAELPDEACSFQVLASNVMREQSTCINNCHVSCSEWFDVSKYLLAIIRRSISSPQPGLSHVLNAVCPEIKKIKPETLILQLELLCVETRAELMKCLVVLLDNISDFESRLTEEKITLASITNRDNILPPALGFLAGKLAPARTKTNFSRSARHPKPKSKEAVLKSWSRLRRKYRLD